MDKIKIFLRSSKMLWNPFEIVLLVIFSVAIIELFFCKKPQIEIYAIPFAISAFLLLLQSYLQKYKNLNKFIKLEGSYQCFSYKNNSNPQSKEYDEIGKANGSNARITYNVGCNLSIEIADKNKNHWIGHIDMQSEYMGVIAWKYDELQGKKIRKGRHRNGLKRCSVFEDKSEKIIWIHLFSDHDERFGREVLRKLAKKTKL